MNIVSAATIAIRYAARYPKAQQGTVDSISAAAGSVPAIDAAAVKGFAAVSGKLQWVRAVDHFYQSGELIQSGDFVQVEEGDAKRLRNSGRAVFATEDEVRAAQSPVVLSPPIKARG